MLGATVVLWLYAMRGISIGRVSGAFFLASYGVYLWLMYTA